MLRPLSGPSEVLGRSRPLQSRLALPTTEKMSLASLEQEGRGAVLDRRSSPQRPGRQHFMLEERFDSALWGERADKAEREWL